MNDDLAERVRSSLQPEPESIAANQLLLEILTVLRHMDSTARNGDVSSVKVTLQRGTVDIAVHAYVGSNIEEAETDALESYRRILTALNQDGVDNFSKALEAVKR
jgi:hypothetical protein